MPSDFTTPSFDELEGFFLLRVTLITFLSARLTALGVCKGPSTPLPTCVVLLFELLDLETTLTDCGGMSGVALDFKDWGSFSWSCSPLVDKKHHLFSGLSKLCGYFFLAESLDGMATNMKYSLVIKDPFLDRRIGIMIFEEHPRWTHESHSCTKASSEPS